MSRLINSTQRRNNRSESLIKYAWFVIRLYSACVSRYILYSISDAFDSCVEYNRIYRRYKLVFLIAEIKRLAFKAEDLRE
jgi:hypothetical protein